MRYYHILALGLCTLFSSCKMYEEMPSCDNYPSTAISQETKALRQLLRSSKHGWMLTLVPGTGQYGGLNLSLQFTSDNEVSIFSEESQTPDKSSYHFSHNGGIRLTFDTFNEVLHHYSNPQWGLPVAYDGDFDFTILRVSEDERTITLRGGHTNGVMQMTRIDEDSKEYFTKITESQQALKGRALAPIQLGGKEVSISIFGYAHQLWVRYDKEQKLLPFAFTDKGMRLLTPFTLGSDTLTTLELNADKTAVSVQGGKQTASLYKGTYDLTEQYTTFSYEGEQTAGSDALALFKQVNETQQSDVYAGTFGNEVYFGRFNAFMPKVSLYFRLPGWLDDTWGNYNMDFTAIYGQPKQFHTTRIIQQDISWLFGHRAYDWYLQSLTSHSPYSIEAIDGDTEHVRISSVASPSTYWMRGNIPVGYAN